MDDAFRHCEELVRAHDKDRFIATLFAPAEKRAPLYALYAFALEIAHVRERVTQPLAGEIRMQWWRDVLSGTATGDEAGHPVAVALMETCTRFALGPESLLTVIDARGAELYADAPQGQAALLAHATATQEAIFAGAARILDAAADDALVGDAAAVHGVAELMHNALWRDAVPPLPRRALCADALARMARMRFADISVVRAPAYLMLAVDQAVLRRAQKSDDPADAQLSQWRRQWMLWRAAHRWPRIVK